MGVNSLPKTVARQRRGCDLNPGATAPESSTLTTRLPSHPPGRRHRIVITEADAGGEDGPEDGFLVRTESTLIAVSLQSQSELDGEAERQQTEHGDAERETGGHDDVHHRAPPHPAAHRAQPRDTSASNAVVDSRLRPLLGPMLLVP